MPMGNEIKELLKEGDGGTVKPPNKGHIGNGPFVPSKEVFLLILRGFILNLLEDS